MCWAARLSFPTCPHSRTPAPRINPTPSPFSPVPDLPFRGLGARPVENNVQWNWSCQWQQQRRLLSPRPPNCPPPAWELPSPPTTPLPKKHQCLFHPHLAGLLERRGQEGGGDLGRLKRSLQKNTLDLKSFLYSPNGASSFHLLFSPAPFIRSALETGTETQYSSLLPSPCVQVSCSPGQENC